MKVVLRKKDAGTIFGDKRVRMSELAAGFIQLETSAAGEPNGRYTPVIKGGGELIQARSEASTRGD
ncbi:MAG: hypothetical protein WA621_06620 [Candidatus Acidiferrum sp.]